MFLICVDTVHHFLIRGNQTCCVVTVLSTVNNTAIKTFTFPFFTFFKIQNPNPFANH